MTGITAKREREARKAGRKTGGKEITGLKEYLNQGYCICLMTYGSTNKLSEQAALTLHVKLF